MFSERAEELKEFIQKESKKSTFTKDYEQLF